MLPQPKKRIATDIGIKNKHKKIKATILVCNLSCKFFN